MKRKRSKPIPSENIRTSEIVQWRNKKTGRWTKPRAKGSYKLIGYVIRVKKGVPAGGQIIRMSLHEREDFKVLKSFRFSKKKGTLLSRYIADYKIGRKVINIRTKFIEVNFFGLLKGKSYADRIVLAIVNGMRVDDVRRNIIGRMLHKLSHKGIRLSSSKWKSSRYTIKQYREMTMLKDVQIEVSYV